MGNALNLQSPVEVRALITLELQVVAKLNVPVPELHVGLVQLLDLCVDVLLAGLQAPVLQL